MSRSKTRESPEQIQPANRTNPTQWARMGL